MKILNLYAGIGGNRKLWGDSHEITAVEIDPEIAKIYHDFFPQDKVIVADAHQYLLDHFQDLILSGQVLHALHIANLQSLEVGLMTTEQVIINQNHNMQT